MEKGNSSSTNKRKRSEPEEEDEEEDRISLLPDIILIRILSFLPTEDAVKTTFLSKRWQYLWIHVPFLSFHLGHNEPSKMLFAERTLTFHTSPKLYKFSVETDAECGDDSPKLLIDRMVRFATTRHVEELTISVLGSYYLPRHLFCNEYLRKLMIDGCHLWRMGRVSWNSLRFLEMVHVCWDDESLGNVLSGCPALECLTLREFLSFSPVDLTSPKLKKLVLDGFFLGEQGDDYDIRIRAPYLKVLELSGNWCGAWLKLVDSHSLINVDLDFHKFPDYENEDACFMLRDILGVIRSPKQLRIGHLCLELFSKMKPAPIYSCKCFEFACFFRADDEQAMFNLLECVPNLKRLTIDFSKVDERYHTKGFWRKPHAILKCLAYHLKVINVISLSDNVSCLEFLKFLLKHAMVLEKLVIHEPRVSSLKDLLKLSAKLLCFPRSSPHAVVLFPDHWVPE